MKKNVLVFLAAVTAAGCAREQPPLETLVPPSPTIVQAPAVIAPYSVYETTTDSAVIEPGSVVLDEELVTAPAPAVIEPKTMNGAPLERESSPAVTPAPQPHYGNDGGYGTDGKNDGYEGGAVNNSDPSFQVSPFAQP